MHTNRHQQKPQCSLLSYNGQAAGTENTFGTIPMRRWLLFLRTFRKARRLGFGLIDAFRAARVNSFI